MTADVTDEASVGRLYDEAQAARGPFDIVVANAGMAESAPAEKISREIWTKILDVNLTGAFLSVNRPSPACARRNGEKIVFIASTAGLGGYPYVAALCGRQTWCRRPVASLAAETAKPASPVNAVCPGFTETPLLDHAVDRIVETAKLAKRMRGNCSRPKSRKAAFCSRKKSPTWCCGSAARRAQP